MQGQQISVVGWLGDCVGLFFVCLLAWRLSKNGLRRFAAILRRNHRPCGAMSHWPVVFAVTCVSWIFAGAGDLWR
jgi:hypothetical protein